MADEAYANIIRFIMNEYSAKDLAEILQIHISTSYRFVNNLKKTQLNKSIFVILILLKKK